MYKHVISVLDGLMENLIDSLMKKKGMWKMDEKWVEQAGVLNLNEG